MAWTERYCIDGGAGLHDGTSEANAWSLAEAIANAAGGHRINVKAATFANTTTSRTFGTGGGAATTAAPKWWRGYKATIGDMDGHPSSTRTAGTDFPLFTFTTGSVTVSDPHNTFSNIEFRGTAPGTRLVGVSAAAAAVKFIRCRFDCQEAAATSYSLRISGANAHCTNCWFKGTSSVNHVVISEERNGFNGCVFRGGGNGVFLDASTGHQRVIDCVFDDNGDDAIECTGSASHGLVVDGCTIYSPGGHGINVTTAIPGYFLVHNNLFHTITVASKYALNLPSGTNYPHVVGNAYYNVTTRFNNLTESLEFFDISESSDPCTNAAGHDFSLVTGASSKGAALAQLFENESYKSWRDAGAVQRQEPAGGSGGGRFPTQQLMRLAG